MRRQSLEHRRGACRWQRHALVVQLAHDWWCGGACRREANELPCELLQGARHLRAKGTHQLFQPRRGVVLARQCAHGSQARPTPPINPIVASDSGSLAACPVARSQCPGHANSALPWQKLVPTSCLGWWACTSSGHGAVWTEGRRFLLLSHAVVPTATSLSCEKKKRSWRCRHGSSAKVARERGGA